MSINLKFQQRLARLVVLLAALIVSGALMGVALTRFALAALTAPQLQVSGDMLAAGASYFPDSARVGARLAARLVESEVNGALSHEQVAELAVYHADRAVKRSPRSYEMRMVAALAREAQGDLAGAENDLRAALSLAPNHLRVRWRLANLLVRAGKPEQAISEFRVITAVTASYLPETLDLVWQASGGDVATMRSVVGDESLAGQPAKMMTLARFFIQQAKPEVAAGIFRNLDARQRLDSPETPGLFDDLIAAGQVELAAQLWRELFSPGLFSNDAQTNIWNGSFETTIRQGLAQFDWNLSQSKYARISLTTDVAHTGRRALEIAYLGIDTTRLEDEIRQLIPIRPNTRYRLEAYAKTEGLITPAAPQIVIANYDSKKVIATSALLEAGSHDWQPLFVEFTSPPDAKAIVLSIKQTPQFSYVEPTRGTVWFDDFTLQQN